MGRGEGRRDDVGEESVGEAKGDEDEGDETGVVDWTGGAVVRGGGWEAETAMAEERRPSWL